jgi:hypothetical protein
MTRFEEVLSAVPFVIAMGAVSAVVATTVDWNPLITGIAGVAALAVLIGRDIWNGK